MAEEPESSALTARRAAQHFRLFGWRRFRAFVYSQSSSVPGRTPV